jgi:hypothetical protein
MTSNDESNQESAGSFLQGPSDETLREARVHDNGDLTIRSEAGEIRLINGSDGWKRYTGYLKVRSIELTVEET